MLISGVALAAGCSGGTSNGAETMAEVPPAEALERLPFSRQLIIPVVGSKNFIWASDFRRLGAYDRVERRWTFRRLPSQLGSLALAPMGNRAVGLMQICRVECDDGVSVEFRLVSFDRTGRAMRLELPGAGALPDKGGAIRGLRADGKTAVFAIEGNEQWFLITVTDRNVSMVTLEGRYRMVCPDDQGWIGLENADEGEDGVVPSDVFDDYRVVAGPSPSRLQPVDPPAGPRALLAQAGRMAVVCGDPGLALVGSGTAWEFSQGNWTSAPSEVVSYGPSPASSFVVYRLPDGTLELMTEGGVIERSATGTWRRREGWDRRVPLGDQVLIYESNVPQP